MQTPEFYVGIDVASETLAVALTRGPGQPGGKPLAVANDPDGFTTLAAWLAEHGAAPEAALVCLESTGVYGEALCYWLHERGFRLAVEDAAKVRRAMPVAGAKTDALDALRIADYAARFLDELRLWAPAEAVVEQVQTLLTMPTHRWWVGAAHARADGQPQRPANAGPEGGPDAAGQPDR